MAAVDSSQYYEGEGDYHQNTSYYDGYEYQPHAHYDDQQQYGEEYYEDQEEPYQEGVYDDGHYQDEHYQEDPYEEGQYTDQQYHNTNGHADEHYHDDGDYQAPHQPTDGYGEENYHYEEQYEHNDQYGVNDDHYGEHDDQYDEHDGRMYQLDEQGEAVYDNNANGDSVYNHREDDHVREYANSVDFVEPQSKGLGPRRFRVSSYGSTSASGDEYDSPAVVRRLSQSNSNPNLTNAQKDSGIAFPKRNFSGNRGRLSSKGSYSSMSDGDISDGEEVRITTRGIKDVAKQIKGSSGKVSSKLDIATPTNADSISKRASPLFSANNGTSATTSASTTTAAAAAAESKAPIAMVPSKPAVDKPTESFTSPKTSKLDHSKHEELSRPELVNPKERRDSGNYATAPQTPLSPPAALPMKPEPKVSTKDAKVSKKLAGIPSAVSSTTVSTLQSSDHIKQFADKKPFLGDKKTNFYLNSVCVSSGNSHIIYVTTSDSSILAYDVFTGEKMATMSGHIDRVLCVACSYDAEVVEPHRQTYMPGTHFVVTGSRDETIRIWDMNYKCTKTIHAHKGPVWAVAAVVRDDVGYCVSCSDEGSIRVWNAHSGVKLFNFKGQKGKVSVLNIVDKRASMLELVSAGQDTHLHIWNLVDGHHLKLLEGHASEVTSVTSAGKKATVGNYSGKSLIISGSKDKSIRIWDFEESVCLAVLLGHSSGIVAVCFAKTLRSSVKPVKVGSNTPVIVSNSEDGSTFVWNMDTGKTIVIRRGHANGIKSLYSCLYGVGNTAASATSPEMLIVSCGWDKALHMFSLDEFLSEEDEGCACTIS